MKLLKIICSNPIVIAITVVHWIVVLYAIYGEQHSQPFHFTDEPLLTQWLLYFNLLPMIFMGVLLQPLIDFSPKSQLIIYTVLFFYFIAISFQWLIIGNIVSKIVDSFKAEGIKFSLKDE